MEKLKTKPSLLQLTKTLRRKEETRPPSKFYFNHTTTRVRPSGRQAGIIIFQITYQNAVMEMLQKIVIFVLWTKIIMDLHIMKGHNQLQENQSKGSYYL